MPEAREDLILYKRHVEACPVHKIKLPVDKRRYWMDCDCPIWIVGRTPDGSVVPRQSTGERDLEKARAFRLALMKQHEEKPHGPALADCIEKYIASRKHELGKKTEGQYKLVLGRLREYCGENGVVVMNKIGVDLLETFKVEGFPEDMEDTSKSTQVAKLRRFLRDAYRRGWITEPLAEKITGHKCVYEQKSPYSDEELGKIFAQESISVLSSNPGRARGTTGSGTSSFRQNLASEWTSPV